jgi:uncharacterized protein
MPLFVITASDIDTHGVTVDADLPPSWIAEELADAEVTAAPGADPESGPRAGHVTARLSRSGTDIVVRGRVSAAVTLPCARCLAPATVDIDGELSLLLKCVPVKPASSKSAKQRGTPAVRPVTGAGGTPAVRPVTWRKGQAEPEPPKAKKKESEYEFSADEADVDTYDGEEVVLDSFIREAMLLELPNFPLCSEACPGIGPPPGPKVEMAKGAPAVVDPRLAPLAALRAKLGPAEEGAPAPVRPKTAQKPASLKASHSKTPKKKNLGAALGTADRDPAGKKKKKKKKE